MKNALLVVAALFLVSCARLSVKPDFLQTGSKDWSRWLDETIDVRIKNLPLHLLPATAEFGSDKIEIKIPDAASIRVTLEAKHLSRRAALWRIAQTYGFKMRYVPEPEAPQAIEISAGQ